MYNKQKFVLVTRPLPHARKTAGKLKKLGFSATISPMLSFRSLPITLENLTSFKAIVITSPRAIDALKLNDLLWQVRELPLFAIGRTSAEMAIQYGLDNVTSADGNVYDLIDVIKTQSQYRDKLLYITGKHHNKRLQMNLADYGVKITTLVGYKMDKIKKLTTEAYDLIATNNLTAVLLYSRRSAEAFRNALINDGLLGAASSFNYYCLSPKIANVIADIVAIDKIYTANKPNEADLLQLLQQTIDNAITDN